MSSVDSTPKRISLHYPLSSEDVDIEKELLKPFTHLMSVPGKQIRLNLIQVLGHWISPAEEKVKHIEEIVHCIHHATLLLDDIQDYTGRRRGIPTAHTVYGIPRTIFAVDTLEARVYDLLDQLHNFELTKRCMRYNLEILAGQGMELYWRDNYICPTEGEYIQMVYRKTALLLLVVEDAMNTFTAAKKIDVRKILTIVGVYFQINDDYQNLQTQFYYDNKGFCEDITEGKFSFPVIHAINNFPVEGKLIKSLDRAVVEFVGADIPLTVTDILRERTRNVERKKECLSILEKCGSFEYTEKVLAQLKSTIYTEIDKLDDNPLINEFIAKAMCACN